MESSPLTADCLGHAPLNTSSPVSLAPKHAPLGDPVRFQAAFDHALVGIFQSTPSGRFGHVNPALARLLGYDSPQALRNAITDAGRDLYVDPKRRTELVRTLNENGAVMNFESEVYRADGRVIWISVNAWVVRDDEGRILYYEGLMEDVTERKEREKRTGQTPAAAWDAASQAALKLELSATLGEAIILLDRLAATPLSPQQHRFVREARVLAESALTRVGGAATR